MAFPNALIYMLSQQENLQQLNAFICDHFRFVNGISPLRFKVKPHDPINWTEQTGDNDIMPRPFKLLRSTRYKANKGDLGNNNIIDFSKTFVVSGPQELLNKGPFLHSNTFGGRPGGPHGGRPCF